MCRNLCHASNKTRNLGADMGSAETVLIGVLAQVATNLIKDALS